MVKLALDGGFTCPNRDGRVGVGGCSFCSEKGSGEFAIDVMDIDEQIERAKMLISKKNSVYPENALCRLIVLWRWSA